MISYIGRHAELYDLFYNEKDYPMESAFVHQYLQNYGIKPPKKILELACGTGSHALALEKYGYQIIATDNSEDMLNCAIKKARNNSSSIEFRTQDMRYLEIPERPFDAVVCLFDSIGYVLTNPALKQVFQGVYNHLTEGGLFIFEFWHAAPMVKSFDPLRIRRWSVPDGEIIRISDTALDVARQVSKVKYVIFEQNDSGTYSKIEEKQENRYFMVKEVELWLTENNFELIHFFAGFSNDTNITDETWHIVAVARRK